MKTFVAALALAAVPGQALALSAKSCLTPPEAEALVTFALPSAIRAMTKKCSTDLPATAALVQSGPVIAARYQIDAAFGAGLTEKVKPDDCRKVDRFVDILEPLPAQNLARLITALIELADTGRKSKSPLQLCAAPQNGN